MILALIDAYYRNPQLWNTSVSKKCSFKQKQDLLQAITDDINFKLQLKLKLHTVKKKLNYICKQYEREIEKQMNQEEKVTKYDNVGLWFFENMSFLKSVVENKISLKRVSLFESLRPGTKKSIK